MTDLTPEQAAALKAYLRSREYAEVQRQEHAAIDTQRRAAKARKDAALAWQARDAPKLAALLEEKQTARRGLQQEIEQADEAERDVRVRLTGLGLEIERAIAEADRELDATAPPVIGRYEANFNREIDALMHEQPSSLEVLDQITGGRMVHTNAAGMRERLRALRAGIEQVRAFKREVLAGDELAARLDAVWQALPAVGPPVAIKVRRPETVK